MKTLRHTEIVTKQFTLIVKQKRRGQKKKKKRDVRAQGGTSIITNYIYIEFVQSVVLDTSHTIMNRARVLSSGTHGEVKHYKSWVFCKESVIGWLCQLQNSHVESLTPSIFTCHLFRDRILIEVIKLEWVYYSCHIKVPQTVLLKHCSSYRMRWDWKASRVKVGDTLEVQWRYDSGLE